MKHVTSWNLCWTTHMWHVTSWDLCWTTHMWHVTSWDLCWTTHMWHVALCFFVDRKMWHGTWWNLCRTTHIWHVTSCDLCWTTHMRRVMLWNMCWHWKILHDTLWTLRSHKNMLHVTSTDMGYVLSRTKFLALYPLQSKDTRIIHNCYYTWGNGNGDLYKGKTCFKQLAKDFKLSHSDEKASAKKMEQPKTKKREKHKSVVKITTS